MEQPDGAPEQQAESPADDPGAADAAAGWQSVGRRLRQAREEAGLTLAEVAARTKVRPGILADIEGDAHDRLPALTYALGFVKAYARTVGIDPAEAGNAYRQESQKLDPVPSIVDLQPLEARRLPSRGLVFFTTFLLLLLLGGFWAWGAGWLTPAMPPSPVPPAAPPPAAPPAAGETADAGTADAASAPAAEGSQVVTLAANEEVWLKISDGDDVFFTGILQPGQTIVLPEGRNWLLRTARGGAIDARVGARAIPSFGGPTKQLYDFPLAPEALLGWVAPPEASGQEGR